MKKKIDYQSWKKLVHEAEIKDKSFTGIAWTELCHNYIMPNYWPTDMDEFDQDKFISNIFRNIYLLGNKCCHTRTIKTNKFSNSNCLAIILHYDIIHGPSIQCDFKTKDSSVVRIYGDYEGDKLQIDHDKIDFTMIDAMKLLEDFYKFLANS